MVDWKIISTNINMEDGYFPMIKSCLVETDDRCFRKMGVFRVVGKMRILGLGI